jgi:hypothetical protein
MSTFRQMRVDVVGNVSGFLAAMNQANLGTSRFEQGLKRTNKEAGLFQKQLLAIGTTARYALAGQVIFGITGAIQKLAEFKSQLGSIDAVAGQVDRNGHFHSMGNQLNDVGNEAILLSNKLGIATTDVQAYMQRFFSSFNVPPGTRGLKDMESFVNRVASLQVQFGAEAGDPQQLAGGIAGLIHNIPGGTKNIPGNTALIANLISNLVSKTPNITGRDIARDIGRIGATMTIARMTPQQAFAVWGQAGMSGGSSSVIGRGVAQLLGTSLLHPQSPAQLAAFRQVGLPTDPNALQQMGGMKVLMQMMQRVAKPGFRVGNRQALLDENLQDDESLRAANIKGVDLTLLYNLFGRQESVRQFVNLLGQDGVQGMQRWLGQQKKAIDVDQQKERFDAALQQKTLLRFTQARQNLSMQLVSGIAWPLENMIAKPVIGVSNLAARHPHATQAATGALLGLAGAEGLRRLGAFGAAAKIGGAGKLGKFGRFLGMAGNVESAAIAEAIKKEELPAAIAGQVADGTRANPFWVIVSPMSRTVGGIPDPVAPGGPGTPGGIVGGSKSWWNKIPKVIPLGAGGLALGAAAVGAAVLSAGGAGYQGEEGHLAFGVRRDKNGKLVIDPSKAGGHSFAQRGIGELASPLLAAMEKSKLQDKDIQRIEVQGEAKADLKIRLVDKTGKEVVVQEHKGVPVRIWQANAAPTSKGRPGKRTKHG